MSGRLMREGLRHEYAGMGDERFFDAIDQSGGWPVGYQFVGFEHTDSRKAGFTNSSANTGWWTVVASADDYYLWKLSPQALQKLADTIIAASRPTKVNAQTAGLRNWRGHFATLAKATGEQA